MHESIISHVSLGTNDLGRAGRFYDAVLGAMGIGRVMSEPFGIGYGRAFPEFWIQPPFDGQRASVGNGVHVSFLARSQAEVDAFHAAALAAGGRDDGPPGFRPEYTPGYYAAFVRDPDGNKIEAMLLVTGA